MKNCPFSSGPIYQLETHHLGHDHIPAWLLFYPGVMVIQFSQIIPRALLLSGCLLRTATSWPNASQVCDHECLGIANPSEINYLTTIWDDFSPHTFPNPHPKCENRKCCAWNQEPHIHCVFDANFPIWLRRLLRWFGNFLVVQHLFVWFIQNRLHPTRIKLSNSQN